MLSLASEALAQSEPTLEKHRGAVEIKLGAYQPSIDSEFGGNGPYTRFFGERSMLQVEGEWDLYLFEKFGHHGVALHAGFTRKSAPVQADNVDIEETLPGNTTLRVIPLRASLLTRVDYFARRYRIPLVPTLKLGVDYYLWRIGDSGGDVSSVDGTLGRGGKLGWHASAGLNLLLDPIAASRAATMERKWGIANTYLFGEFLHTDVDGFGAGGFDFSDNQWLFGLAVEF
jgi:hypothetical protein